MKVLAIGDPHCKISTIGEILKLKSECVRLIKEHEPELVVVLGDLHDTFEKAHVLAFNAMIDLLRTLASYSITVYVIGNHDLVNNQEFLSDNHFFQALNEDGDDLIIADKPFWAWGCVFCPYVPNGRLLEALEKVENWREAKAIFCHQEFKGAKMGAIESEHGDEWHPDWPLVISGHVHEHQTLFGGKVIYVGTPYTTGFGETERKTVSLFELGAEVKETRIELAIPRKETLKVHVSEVGSVVLPANTVVRLSIEGTTAELTAFRKTKKYKELSEVAKVVFKPLDPEAAVQSIKRQSYHDLLKESCAKETPVVQRVLSEVLKT